MSARWWFFVGLMLTGCARKESVLVSSVEVRRVASLPSTTLDWLSLKDHFVATVGPSAGQGAPMGPLLVLADATFAPGSRFPLHPHRELEILSVVLDGELSHHGDGANGMTVKARGAQLISSRDGIVHAEGNDTAFPVRMLQIWIEPTTKGGAPSYFYRQLPSEPGRHLVAGDEGMPLRRDVKVWWLDVNGPSQIETAAGRRAYVLALTGSPALGAKVLADGDGAVVSAGTLTLSGSGAVLLFDVPL